MRLFVLSIILVTYSLALTTDTGSSSNTCTPLSCAYCNKVGDSKFCTRCIGTNMVGTANNRKCSDPIPEGCISTKATSDSPQASIYCDVCDEKNNYHLVNHVEKSNSSCLKCDLSTNYISISDCVGVSNKIENCAQYGHSDVLCTKCEEYYSLTSDKTMCVQNLPHCEVMENESACNLCNSGSHLHGGECAYNISNCTTADPQDPSSRCNICETGYVLDTKYGDSCLQITVLNCASSIIGESHTCTTCLPGYYLLDPTSCQKGQIPNCSTYSSEKECETCQLGFVRKEDKSECGEMDFRCISAISTDSFKCVECKSLSGFYATDVIGKEPIVVGDSHKWEQLCTTTGSRILAILGITSVYLGNILM